MATSVIHGNDLVHVAAKVQGGAGEGPEDDQYAELFILWMLIGGQGKEEYYDCHMHPAFSVVTSTDYRCFAPISVLL